ncbi:hypothetical protein M0R45_009754 [Rubus argutus]|uniref:Uncharacterized protein n=1 Tax=Rubus argutus TaxID=59490 RepID=A0AAW1Y532_RUBAR
MADDLARSFQNIDLGGQDDEAKKAKDLAKKQKAAEKEKRKAENENIIEEKRRRLKEEVKSIVFDRKKPVHPIKQNIWDFKDIIDHIRKQPNPPSSFEEQSPVDFSIIEAAYKSNADILSRITKMLKEFYDTEDYAIKVPSRGKQH